MNCFTGEAVAGDSWEVQHIKFLLRQNKELLERVEKLEALLVSKLVKSAKGNCYE